ncbi:hypothetical protein BOW53_16810 [Solemya pervernicosa gill symbiont]|uniref:Integrase catalytic domain-containing protein n=1 Tax=Solemya pervernicosa gill symbiont TaxID=642797 RepID=A0A1T2KZ39_9GAMM|nr:hypothetical protein BOW53_16810 [Solemya pervernicosa gill symbiont]
MTDITYIRTYEGWLYLAVVMDLYSRMIIGWSMKTTLAKEIVLDALLMAIWRRTPEQDVVIHSDQGSQYSSDEWTRFCKTNNLIPSMSRRGNCYDNAAAESFFSSLKKEKIRGVVIFAEACFGHPGPSKQQKLNATVYACGAPTVLRTLRNHLFAALHSGQRRRHIFKTREEARAEIFDYIEVFYNRARRHQHLGNISPQAYEEQMAKLG